MATIQKYYFPNPYYEGRRSLATNYAVGLADVEARLDRAARGLGGDPGA